ncbi:MAG: VOC family protein [Terracidiphilus sp.]|nr:VOC family protein [Terracidiphilus sp.]
MGHPAQHHAINYIEFTTADVAAAKKFYSTVFGWTFQDWGPDYASFASEHAGIDGGFRRGPAPPASENAPLIVLYSKNLEATEAAIVAAGGSIEVPIFTFPGGRRFHFNDNCGNTLAVWSE